MTIRTYIATSIMLAILVAGMLPMISSAACVNGRLTDDQGRDVGTCDNSVTTAPDTNADPSANINFSDTYAYKRQGVFGCSLNGSYSMSVGALGAVGGVYVPVNDAAVTLNTGYLVYKECVLRGVVNRQREAATAALQKQVLSGYNTGRDGQPYFSSNLVSEELAERDRVVLLNLQNGTLNTLNPAFKQSVTRAIAQGYASARNQPNRAFECRYSGNLKSLLNGRPDASFYDALTAGMNPACNPYFAYVLADTNIQSSANLAVGDLRTRLDWYNGNYPVQKFDEYGNPVVLTPGSVVGANALQALQTGFVQLQNANDIDQMVGALFAGITSQVIGDNRGLLGLLQKTGSQASYLDQVVKESAQGLRDSAANAALQILSAAKQVELSYKQLMNDIANTLSSTILSLRAKENACWQLIVDKVCATKPDSNKKCQATADSCSTTPDENGQVPACQSGYNLQVATSTAFSKTVIDARVTPLASSTITNIEKANNSITLIDKLIAGITNSASLDAQRVALQQLDNLVAQRQLHNQYDVTAAQKAKDDVTASMETLMTNTVKDWAESPDPNVGWCNINNKNVLDFWKKKWRI